MTDCAEKMGRLIRRAGRSHGNPRFFRRARVAGTTRVECRPRNEGIENGFGRALQQLASG